MSADQLLHHAYQEWRRLAGVEGNAIRAGNWSLLNDCQNALRQLQPQILRYTRQAREERCHITTTPCPDQISLRALIQELIEIESRNNSLLNELRQAAQARLGQLTQAGRTLSQVKRSYAPAGPAQWTSLS